MADNHAKVKLFTLPEQPQGKRLMRIEFVNSVAELDNKITEFERTYEVVQIEYLDPRTDNWWSIDQNLASNALQYYLVRVCGSKAREIEPLDQPFGHAFLDVYAEQFADEDEIEVMAKIKNIQTSSAQELRRVAAWCLKAADHLEKLKPRSSDPGLEKSMQ